MFYRTFVQIGVFNWLSGRQKVSIFIKMFKNLLLRNHMEDEAETWHTCLGHRLIMGKVEIDNFGQVIGDI